MRRTLPVLMRIIIIGSYVFWSVLTEAQSDPNATLQQALADAREGRLEQAIQGFRDILKNNPDHHRVRLELADVYRRSGQFDQAEQHARQVLEQPGLPDTVRDNIQSFLAQVDRNRRDAIVMRDRPDNGWHQWNASLDFALGYDDNVNAGPGGGLIPVTISNITFTQQTPTERDDFYLRFIGQLNHTYQISSAANAFGPDTDLALDSGIILYRQQYFSESDFNADFISLRAGPTLRKRDRWRAGLYPQYGLIRLDEQLLAHFYGLNPTFNWEANQRAPLFLNGSIERRDYVQSADQERDSIYYSAGFSQLYVPPSFAWLFSFSASAFHENARAEHLDNQGFDLEGEARWLSPSGLEVYARALYRRTDYESEEPLFATGREDDELELELGTQYSVSGWVLKIRGLHKKVESSIELFGYRRNQVEVALIRRW